MKQPDLIEQKAEEALQRWIPTSGGHWHRRAFHAGYRAAVEEDERRVGRFVETIKELDVRGDRLEAELYEVREALREEKCTTSILSAEKTELRDKAEERISHWADTVAGLGAQNARLRECVEELKRSPNLLALIARAEQILHGQEDGAMGKTTKIMGGIATRANFINHHEGDFR